MNSQLVRSDLKFTNKGISKIVKDHRELATIEPDKLAKIIDELKLGLNGNNQKIVSMDQLEQLINEGWEYVRDIPNNRAIVRLSR